MIYFIFYILELYSIVIVFIGTYKLRSQNIINTNKIKSVFCVTQNMWLLFFIFQYFYILVFYFDLTCCILISVDKILTINNKKLNIFTIL